MADTPNLVVVTALSTSTPTTRNPSLPDASVFILRQRDFGKAEKAGKKEEKVRKLEIPHFRPPREENCHPP